ncbi:NADH-quinone oxidoreductase subunit C [Streptomyces spinosirectus]
MSTVGWLPAPAEELFGAQATAEESYELLTVDVPPASWLSALEVARDRLTCTYFDWLSAVDEPGTGFRVSAHVVSLSPVRRLLVRTTVPHEAPALPSAVGVYAGAAWHERETHEMFGVVFEGHPGLDHLLLPETFEGHPLRKDFVLAARVVKAWPGAKEPGESDHGGPKRRQMLPPGVPDPNEWGPQKGQLPPAPARPARGAGRAAGERPVRRSRSAGEGSASQASAPAGGAGAGAGAGASTGAAAGTPRRARTAAEGSASQAAAPGEGADAPRRSRSAAEGSASRRTDSASGGDAAAGPRRARTAGEGSASQRPAGEEAASQRPAGEGSTSQRPAGESGEAQAAGGAGSSPRTAGTESPEAPNTRPTPRSSDAPWHHARPAFDEPAAADRESSAEPPSSEEEEAPADKTRTAPEDRPTNPEDPATNPEDPRTNPEDPAGGPQ